MSVPTRRAPVKVDKRSTGTTINQGDHFVMFQADDPDKWYSNSGDRLISHANADSYPPIVLTATNVDGFGATVLSAETSGSGSYIPNSQQFYVQVVRAVSPTYNGNFLAISGSASCGEVKSESLVRLSSSGNKEKLAFNVEGSSGGTSLVYGVSKFQLRGNGRRNTNYFRDCNSGSYIFWHNGSNDNFSVPWYVAYKVDANDDYLCQVLEDCPPETVSCVSGKCLDCLGPGETASSPSDCCDDYIQDGRCAECVPPNIAPPDGSNFEACCHKWMDGTVCGECKTDDTPAVRYENCCSGVLHPDTGECARCIPEGFVARVEADCCQEAPFRVLPDNTCQKCIPSNQSSRAGAENCCSLHHEGDICCVKTGEPFVTSEAECCSKYAEGELCADAPATGLPDGASCTDHDQCESGECLFEDENAIMGVCGTATTPPKLPDGQPCTQNSQCVSDLCEIAEGETDGLCAPSKSNWKLIVGIIGGVVGLLLIIIVVAALLGKNTKAAKKGLEEMVVEEMDVDK